MIPLVRQILPGVLLATLVTTVTDKDNGSLGGGTGISLREAVKYSPAAEFIPFCSPWVEVRHFQNCENSRIQSGCESVDAMWVAK